MCVLGPAPMIRGMTAIKASLLILVAVAAPAQSAAAAELFVSPSGRDSWPGTRRPWRPSPSTSRTAFELCRRESPSRAGA
jgi:hypothetical protein